MTSRVDPISAPSSSLPILLKSTFAPPAIANASRSPKNTALGVASTCSPRRWKAGREYDQACAFGYSYFQGYFFARPQVISAAEVPATKLNQLRVLRELQQADLNFGRLEELVQRDLSLAPKLLRYVNSAAFAFQERTSSIMRALVILGEQNSRKLIALALMAGLVSNQPP